MAVTLVGQEVVVFHRRRHVEEGFAMGATADPAARHAGAAVGVEVGVTTGVRVAEVGARMHHFDVLAIGFHQPVAVTVPQGPSRVQGWRKKQEVICSVRSCCVFKVVNVHTTNVGKKYSFHMLDCLILWEMFYRPLYYWIVVTVKKDLYYS